MLMECYCTSSEYDIMSATDLGEHTCTSYGMMYTCMGPFTVSDGQTNYNLGSEDVVAIYAVDASTTCSNFEVQVEVRDFGHEMTWMIDGQVLRFFF